jgi:hypothetical protein
MLNKAGLATPVTVRGPVDTAVFRAPEIAWLNGVTDTELAEHGVAPPTVATRYGKPSL